MDPNDGNRRPPESSGPGNPDPQWPFDSRNPGKRGKEYWGNGPNRYWNSQPPYPNGRQGPYPPPYRAGADDTRVFSILSDILWIVGLLCARNNPVVKFHVNQGIILSIFEFILGFSVSILRLMVDALFIRAFSWTFVLPRLGETINGLFSFAVLCFFLVYPIIGIVRAAQGRQQPLPIIGTLFTVI